MARGGTATVANVRTARGHPKGIRMKTQKVSWVKNGDGGYKSKCGRFVIQEVSRFMSEQELDRGYGRGANWEIGINSGGGVGTNWVGNRPSKWQAVEDVQMLADEGSVA